MTRFTTPDSYKLKLGRAKAHLSRVSTLMQEHFGEKRYMLTAEIDKVTGKLKVFCPPLDADPEMVLAAADCVSNVRACLDHLICQIVTARKNVDAITNRHAFPICESVDDFSDQVGSKVLKHIPFEAITLLEAMQPYRPSGEVNRDHPLYELRELSNTDKHRAIYHATPDIRELKITIDGNGEKLVHEVNRTCRPGDLVFEGQLPFPVPPKGPVGVEIRCVYRVTFEQFPVREKVIAKVLSGIIEHVEHTIIPQLEPFAR